MSEIIIQEFRDDDYITSIITNDLIWPWVSDDSIVKSDYCPSDEMTYLEIITDGDRAGFFVIHPFGAFSTMIHTVIDPNYWGASVGYAKAVVNYIFAAMTTENILTMIPEDNTKAIRLAEKTGMTREGTLTKSIKKSGVFLSQHIYSINRGANKCPQQQ